MGTFFLKIAPPSTVSICPGPQLVHWTRFLHGTRHWVVQNQAPSVLHLNNYDNYMIMHSPTAFLSTRFFPHCLFYQTFSNSFLLHFPRAWLFDLFLIFF